jgi:hypothetical protein
MAREAQLIPRRSAGWKFLGAFVSNDIISRLEGLRDVSVDGFFDENEEELPSFLKALGSLKNLSSLAIPVPAYDDLRRFTKRLVKTLGKLASLQRFSVLDYLGVRDREGLQEARRYMWDALADGLPKSL